MSPARLLSAVLLTAVAGTVAGAYPAAAATAPSDGATFTVTSVNSGKLLDVVGSSTADGAQVIQYAARGQANQRWTTRVAAGGAYTVVNAHSGKCLAVSGASTAAGAAVVQSTCVAGATEQRWSVATTGGGISTVRSVRSNLCLDVPARSRADGALVEQWTCNGGTNQQWRFDTYPGTGTRVGAWSTGLSPGGIGFDNQTVRQIVHVSAGGSAPQLRVSNLFGSGTLSIGHVDVAVQASGGTAVTGSHRAVTFGGSGSLSLPTGQERVSDSINLTVDADRNLLVSIHLSTSITSTSWHSGATGTTWVSTAGDHAAEDGTGNYPTTNTSWFLLAGLTVVSPTAGSTLVAFGDSITDGYGSTNNTNRRYPDHLARRLVAASGGPRLGVVNVGIGGNRVLTDAGTVYGYSALHRFSRDALGQPGVSQVLLLEGVNDIRGSTVTAQQIISAYQTLIAQAHGAGVAIHGGTILAFNGSSGWTTTQENVRTSINAWIRTSGAFDSVVDFDAALRDPASPTRLLPAYDRGDHLHPNDAGYAAMANAVDLSRLRY
ncbi:RICIN domain-containing protein [Micromonospora sp. 067-2]|uniref:RICIN domain-containing protein n=1 Tax=Micromonospora sp. 067-2 TaxID=2789270 RepID=UPI003979B7E3